MRRWSKKTATGYLRPYQRAYVYKILKLNKFDQTATRHSLTESRKRQQQFSYSNYSKPAYKPDRKHDRVEGPYRKESHDYSKSIHDTKKEEPRNKPESNAYRETDPISDWPADKADIKKRADSNSWIGDDEEDFEDHKRQPKSTHPARDRKPEKPDDKKTQSTRKDICDGYAYQNSVTIIPKVYFQRKDIQDSEIKEQAKPPIEATEDRKTSKKTQASPIQQPQEDLVSSSARYGSYKQTSKQDRPDKHSGNGYSKNKRTQRGERNYRNSEEEFYLPREKSSKDHQQSDTHKTATAAPQHKQATSSSQKTDKTETHPPTQEKNPDTHHQSNSDSTTKSHTVLQPPSSISSPTTTAPNTSSQAEKQQSIPLLTALGASGSVGGALNSYIPILPGYPPFFQPQVSANTQGMQTPASSMQYMSYMQPTFFPSMAPYQYYYPQQYAGVPQMQPGQQMQNQMVPNTTYMMFPGFQTQPQSNNTQQ